MRKVTNNKKRKRDLRQRQSQRKAKWVFGIFALIIIPIYTIGFAFNANIFLYSFSAVGTMPTMFNDFVIWGIMSAIFFFSFLCYLFRLTRFEGKKTKRTLYLACSLLVVTVFIPFLPEIYPFLSSLHNVLAMSSALLMLIVLFIFVRSLQDCKRYIYKRAIIYLSILAFVLSSIFFMMGVNSLLELIFVIAVCLFLFLMLLWLHADTPDGKG